MEVENQTPSESIVTETPNPVPAESAANAAPSAAPEGQAHDGNTPNEQSAWTPDFKFKVMDKEYEIDPMFRPIIKDEDTLKKIRRMQEQVLGLPHLEASRDEFKNKYQQVAPRLQEYETVERKLGKLSHFVSQRDFGSFFDELKIPRGEVLKWVKHELDMEALPSNVREQMERARQLTAKQWDAEQELEHYRQQEAMTQQEQIHQQVDGAIQHLAGNIAEQFNSRMNSPEAFRHAVFNKGAAIQQQTGQKMPLQEVIGLVKQDLARVMGITEQTAAAHVQGQPAQDGQVQNPAPAKDKPPVIPAIKAGAASPVRTPPKTIADLKKLAASME
jgi:hypothetical protein